MTLHITIDGRSLSVEAGQTVLQAARTNGIDIPTLCDYPGLTSHGSCRMCVVEIEGRANTPTACTTPVEDGMVIRTDCPNVHALRVELFKLLLSEHPACCLFCEEKSHCDECMVTVRKTGVTTGCRSCPNDGQCKLQALAERLHLAKNGYPVRYRLLPVHKSDPFFDRDYNLCVLCERCVRVCEENHFSSPVTLTSRGTNTVVGTAFGRTLLESGCSFCGACVEACPTGALSEKTRKWSGVPEQEVSTTCTLCSAGCQMRLLVRNGAVIGSLPDQANGTDLLCVKGRFGITEMVNSSTRLQCPELIDAGSNVPVTWEQAIEIAAEKIAACDPQKYGLIVSADCSNETLYIAQKFVREAIGSKSIYLSSAAAYGSALPILQRLYASSRPLSALSDADTILCLGFDGKYAQSAVETELHYAKRAGARLISVHPEKHSLSRFADEWLQPAADEEAAFLKTLIEIVRAGAGAPLASPIPRQAQRAGGLLRESKRPVVLVGPFFLTHPDNASLLNLVEQVSAQIRAQLVLLPEQANLAGALQMGMTTPLSATDLQSLEVLHLIGEALPGRLSHHPFVLYQNICPLASPPTSGLVLPAASFTEEDGTFIDHAGALRRTRKAVQARGTALPSWEVLCRIAQKLKVPGFVYGNEAQVRAEMESMSLPGPEQDGSVSSLSRSDAVVFSTGLFDDHTYMGFPLRTWVAGFQALYPVPSPTIE